MKLSALLSAIASVIAVVIAAGLLFRSNPTTINGLQPSIIRKYTAHPNTLSDFPASTLSPHEHVVERDPENPCAALRLKMFPNGRENLSQEEK